MYNNFSGHLPRNGHTEKLIAGVRDAADKYIGTPIKDLKYSLYAEGLRTGERLNFEAEYIEHRRRLNAFLVMTLYEDNDVYLKELEDIIWAICDEFAWCIPAHAHISKCENIQDYVTTIDLFASETAFYLSEAVYLTKDRISKMVYDRVEFEIRRRIVNPYMNNDIQWVKNNWSAVCPAGVAAAMIYLGMDEELNTALPRLEASVADFLDSYENDGCCMEGALYWMYGFGFFCYYARLLREYTNGKTDYFKNPKVKNIAGFGQNMYIGENNTVPFSDAPHELSFNIGLFMFLSEEYGYSIPPEKYENLFDDDLRYRMCNMLRDFYWYDENKAKQGTDDTGYTFYTDSMWYINKKSGYAFAAKGGCNAEPHNHNDLGSFIFYSGGKYIIDDLGWPVYERDYFNKSVRYKKNLCASARGHNLPQPCDYEQIPGENGTAKVLRADESVFELDLSGAYNADRIVRRFELNENGIEITDEFSEDIRERLVTRIKPQLSGSGSNQYVMIDGRKIKCPEACSIKISEESFRPRNNIVKSSMKDLETAYLIDFILKPNQRCAKIIITK